jgi:hypothetical protein
MEDPKDKSDDLVRNALSGFNAEKIVDDPDDESTDRNDDLPAATPDSPNPI